LIDSAILRLAAGLLLGSCAGAQEQNGAAPQADGNTPLTEAIATITPVDFRARIGFLADDALRGRDTPSPGLEVAAAYIASEFRSFGLKPAGDSGSYLQRWPFRGQRPPNVVGILEGSDSALSATYIVFSAHMDHVGVGAPDEHGDSIYNGADDDASGTSAILELAEAFASLPEPPARSLIFLTVSGEEQGLLGSAYFADHPPVLIESIVANINIDMIGRNSPDSAVVIGQEYSSLGPLAAATAQAHTELRLSVGPDPWPEERFFFRSDHFHFARREIPALFFFTGVHEDYHRPSDHVDSIDVDKAARIARLIFHVGFAIAADSQPPRWTQEGLAEVRRLTGER
jgi:hypothetical protein